MSYNYIAVESSGAVNRITLNRPEVMNAINEPMHRELEAAFSAFARNPEQRLCMLTGAGDKAFCAGSDLKAAAGAEVYSGAYPEHGYAGLTERFDLEKPVIAVVNGFALGGGFELALACDLIISSENAVFGLPEPLVGAVALAGGLHRLAREIGLKQAMGIILTARQVTAEEGLRLGFVNEVVPPAELGDTARRWCDEMLRCAPLSLAASKQTVMRGLDEASLADALHNQHDYPAYRTWRQAEDTLEGPRAFAKKRKPVWRGV